MRNSLILKTLTILSIVIITIFGGLAYLFNQSNNKLIHDIRTYNLNSAIKALDERLESRLLLNKEQMKESLNMIGKNSSSFLRDFDREGLKKSLQFDMKKNGIVAVNIWDSALKQNFLSAMKENNTIIYDTKISEAYTKYVKLTQDIIIKDDLYSEKMGEITLYYDESFIIEEINKLKTDTKTTITNFDKEIDIQKQKSNMIKMYIAIGGLLTILVMIWILLFSFVNKPLRVLKSGLDDFFLFLQNKKDHTNKITINTKDEFGQMAHSLNENISVSAKLHEEIYELNANLEKRIEEKTQKVTTLLNNADQGFLSFGDDLIIDKEYSKECHTIFKKDIAGLNIGELLYTNNTKKDFFKETLQSLLQETNKLKIKTIISLLQNEFIINKKAINIQYKIIDNEKFMLILTDITAKKILEKKINKERNILKMIVAVVSDSDEFFELFDDFKTFIESKNKLIDKTKTPLHNVTEIYRTIHTFKGLFSQKEMNNITNYLHKIESSISTILSSQDNSNETIEDLLVESDFNSFIEKDIQIIKEVLGEELFNQRGKIIVKEETISQIENNIITIAQKHNELNEYQPIVKDIQNLKNKTLYSMLSSYPKLLDQLSQRMSKSIYPLEIIMDRELKASDTLKPFTKSLVHVFRNSIDHGIESMDRRAEIEKDEIGTITCTIKKVDKNLHFIIADDGAGLDLEKIKNKADELGINTDNMDKEELQKLIFNDQFTTNNTVSQTSGRGVGMAVVKHECEKLNGTINISSHQDKGTTFEFIVPFQ